MSCWRDAGATTPLYVSSQRRGDVAVASVVGELDIATARDLKLQLMKLLAKPTTDLVLDLEGLAFIDSSGLAALLRVQTVAQERDVHLTLMALPEHARRVMELTGLLREFRVADDGREHDYG